MRRHSSCLLSRDGEKMRFHTSPVQGMLTRCSRFRRRYSSIFGQPERNWLKFHWLFTRNLIRSTIEVITRIVYTRWICIEDWCSNRWDVLEIITGKISWEILTNKTNDFESFESEIISIISVLITFCCIRTIVSVIILISSWNNFVENYIHILQTRLFNTRFDFFSRIFGKSWES